MMKSTPVWLQDKIVFRSFIGLILTSIFAAIILETPLFLLAPVGALGLGFILDDYRRLFYLIFLSIPFSIEYYSDAIGVGTDLPSEPLMIIMAGITLMVWMKKHLSLKVDYWKNPIVLLLFIHLFWILITAIQSQNPIISFKVFTAKIWYVLPFFIFPLITFKERVDFEKTYNILYRFLFLAILIVLVRHAMEGFSFASTNKVVTPFFRNHVSYAAISVVTLPFVWAFMRIRMLDHRPVGWLIVVFILFIIGIYFSFTRAAILSMFIALGAWYIIKKRWVKQALTLSSMVAIVGVIFLSWNNKYMEFTPDFERTVTHYKFDNLIEATYKLEDISSMERVYRWMAGVEMIKDRFWMGFGPGTFYSNYKAYSISRFQTYVSDNPEHSGIHNYYLMTWVEQGLIGFIIFITLCFILIVQAENLYHRCTDRHDQYIIMASALGFIIIFAMNLINDLIETDKVGPFFFFNAAILVYYTSKYAHHSLNSSHAQTSNYGTSTNQ
ncbi:MAG: O-antigen ligase family protein [Chitinophagales bacterium]|nr:O-antigen ligase family protein [Chitinophagales bacterium]